MITDGHIYTLNHDIKLLEQQLDEDDHYAPTVCDTYYINDDAKPRKANMIANIDDMEVDDAEILESELGIDMREIWSMQDRFERRAGQQAFRLLENKRFRAAYDFLLLRAATGEDEDEETT